MTLTQAMLQPAAGLGVAGFQDTAVVTTSTTGSTFTLIPFSTLLTSSQDARVSKGAQDTTADARFTFDYGDRVLVLVSLVLRLNQAFLLLGLPIVPPPVGAANVRVSRYAGATLEVQETYSMVVHTNACDVILTLPLELDCSSGPRSLTFEIATPQLASTYGADRQVARRSILFTNLQG